MLLSSGWLEKGMEDVIGLVRIGFRLRRAENEGEQKLRKMTESGMACGTSSTRHLRAFAETGGNPWLWRCRHYPRPTVVTAPPRGSFVGCSTNGDAVLAPSAWPVFAGRWVLIGRTAIVTCRRQPASRLPPLRGLPSRGLRNAFSGRSRPPCPIGTSRPAAGRGGLLRSPASGPRGCLRAILGWSVLSGGLRGKAFPSLQPASRFYATPSAGRPRNAPIPF